MKKQRCSSTLDTRVKYVGNYEKFACEILVDPVDSDDSGEWSCEVEDYVWGSLRGATHKRTLQLEVVQEGKGQFKFLLHMYYVGRPMNCHSSWSWSQVQRFFLVGASMESCYGAPPKLKL